MKKYSRGQNFKVGKEKKQQQQLLIQKKWFCCCCSWKKWEFKQHIYFLLISGLSDISSEALIWNTCRVSLKFWLLFFPLTMAERYKEIKLQHNHETELLDSWFTNRLFFFFFLGLNFQSFIVAHTFF